MSKNHERLTAAHQQLLHVLANLEEAQKRLIIAPVPSARFFESKMRLLKQLEDVLTSARSLAADVHNSSR